VHAGKRGLRNETRGCPRHFKTKKGVPLLPGALNRCNFLMTLEISTSEIDKGDGTMPGYIALGLSEK
jgi:hypothetical protein